MESATLVDWNVKPGDVFKRGDVVACVETTKGILDVEIFADGVVETLVAQPGTQVTVGGVLATYRSAASSSSAEAEAKLTQPGPAPAPPVTRPAAAPPAPGAKETPAPARRTLASPAARRRAQELGIEIDEVERRDRDSVITLEDVERAAARRSQPMAPADATSDMRALIGQAMSRSKREIPHYYLGTTIAMQRAVDFVGRWNAAHPVTERLMYAALLIKAVARALEKAPWLNGFWRDGRFEPGAAVNVGMATRLRRGGLVAPALEAANLQSLPDLMHRFQDMVQRARAGRLRQAELANATITVSSLGDAGVDTLYPIIHPPQVAIVGFGAVVTRPWCADGAVVAAPVIHATLSADHRASDGHQGSDFLRDVDRWLQRPEEL